MCCHFWKHWYKQHFSLNLDVGDLGGLGKEMDRAGYLQEEAHYKEMTQDNASVTMPPAHLQGTETAIKHTKAVVTVYTVKKNLFTRSRKSCGSHASQVLGGESKISDSCHSTDLYLQSDLSDTCSASKVCQWTKTQDGPSLSMTWKRTRLDDFDMQ